MHRLSFVRLQSHTLETAQRAVRHGILITALDIDLHDLLSRDIAAVLHRDFNVRAADYFHIHAAHVRVAQTVPERVEYILICAVAVSPALHAVVMDIRQEVSRSVERHRELSARGDVAEKQIRERTSAQLSPGTTYPAARRTSPQRSPSFRRKHDNKRLAELLQLPEENTLALRQAQVGLVTGAELVAGVALLALEGRVKTYTGYDHVGALRHGKRLGIQVAGLRETLGAVLVEVAAWEYRIRPENRSLMPSRNVTYSSAVPL